MGQLCGQMVLCRPEVGCWRALVLQLAPSSSSSVFKALLSASQKVHFSLEMTLSNWEASGRRTAL